MEVILLEDVKSLGKKGETVKVSDGYALNYLFPKNLAVEATDSAVKKLNSKIQADKYKEDQNIKSGQELAKDLETKKIIIYTKAGDNGKLFGAITSKEISDEINSQLGINIDKKKILLDEPIKSLGLNIIKIKLYKNIIAELSLEIRSKF